ncbi:MAG: LLM class flavin-dependent oxidoreductase [Acidimicrobiales bacterium]
MEFGVFHEFPSLPGRPDEDAFDEAFDLVDVAEQGGLDAVWLAEPHFDPARSVLSAPLWVASAIAALRQDQAQLPPRNRPRGSRHLAHLRIRPSLAYE